ncbi:MAG: C10 family peptidase [Bacteroidales bacterium]|nr:C10 family peptidase [Bacteroidales bacterium]
MIAILFFLHNPFYICVRNILTITTLTLTSTIKAILMRHLRYYLFFPLFVFLFACNKEVSLPLTDVRAQIDATDSLCPQLPKDLLNLSAEDAKTVATLFVRKNPSTKTNGVRIVKEVIPIYGEDSDILMYAINFTDGYIIISATTNYYPILAIIDHGSFSITANSGQELLLNEIKAEVAQSKITPIKDAGLFWEDYRSTSSIQGPTTKSATEYYSMLNSYLGEWLNDGGNVYYLKQKPDNMPDEMYEAFCEEARIEMPWDYPYMDYAIITEKYCTVTTSYGPLLQTFWDQHGNGDGTGINYNSAVPNNMDLGCVTVAVGQIMRCFEYPPQAYNWNIMPNRTSNAELSSFLATLRTQLKVDNNGASSIQKAKKTLQDYGYSVRLQKHEATDVCTSLSHNRPVYMRGEDPNKDTGHAWVCDGYLSSYNYYEYHLFLVRKINGELKDFIDWMTDRVYFWGPSFFHMNWGWGGSHNGYYLDNKIQVKPGKYTDNRKDLIITTPLN